MEITYSKYGNYYLPDLVVSDEEPTTYGRFGRMRLRYLTVSYTHLTLPTILLV